MSKIKEYKEAQEELSACCEAERFYGGILCSDCKEPGFEY